MTIISLLALALCAAQAQPPAMPADIQWDGVYDAEKLPDEVGWGASKGDNTFAEITPDGLRIVDEGTERTELHCYSYRWGARPDRGAIAQATVKAVSSTGVAGMCLHVSDGAHEDSLNFYPDRIELSGAGLSYPMDTTADFFTYQVRISGMNIQVWVDDAPVIDGWGKFAREAHNGRCVIQFGSISSPATGEAYWKDVRFAVNTIPVQRIEGAEDVVIYYREGIYACFPSLYRAADGRLFTSFGTRARRSHIDPTGGSARAVSADDGRTWELTDESLPDPRFIREDGTTLRPHARGWVYVDEAELDDIKERGRSWMKAREGVVAYLGDPRASITDPDGETRVIELETPTPAGVMGFNASSFLRSGDLWMMAIYGRVQAGGPSAVWVIRSEDNGETWEVVQVAAPLSDDLGLNETALCENDRGEIIAVMRPQPERHNSYQVFSADGGRTWSEPRDTGFWGYPSNVIRLRDGRLLCTYGYRRDAQGVRAVISEDGGHTWDVDNEIIIRADGKGAGGDNGYPISIELDDGHIFTIYYLNDTQNVTHVAGTHWRVP